MPGSGAPGWNAPGQYHPAGPPPADTIVVPFIGAATVVFTPDVQVNEVDPPFIAAATTVFTPTLVASGVRRLSQGAVEVVVLPSDQKARLSQGAVEVVIGPAPAARATQVPVEIIVQFVHEEVHWTVIEYHVGRP